MNFDPIGQMPNALVHVGRRAPRHADDAIAFAEQKFRQI